MCVAGVGGGGRGVTVSAWAGVGWEHLCPGHCEGPLCSLVPQGPDDAVGSGVRLPGITAGYLDTLGQMISLSVVSAASSAQWKHSHIHLITLLGESSRHGAAERNLTGIHEDVGSIPHLAHWVKDLVLLGAVMKASRCSFDSTPCLGTSICHACGPKQQNKQTNKRCWES